MAPFNVTAHAERELLAAGKRIDEELDLQELGKLQITRASHVKPDLDGNWQTDMGPVEGPVPGRLGAGRRRCWRSGGGW